MDPHRSSGWRKVKSEWCNACKMNQAAEVHHKIARSDNGCDEEWNLIDLCRQCHKYAPNGIIEVDEYVRIGGYIGYIIQSVTMHTYNYLLDSNFLDQKRVKKTLNTVRSKFFFNMIEQVKNRYRKNTKRINEIETKKQLLERKLEIDRIEFNKQNDITKNVNN